MISYSHKSLPEKLGLKPGFLVALFSPPTEYFQLLTDLPEDITFAQDEDEPVDLVHCFVTNHNELESIFPRLRDLIKPNGQVWISWPKGASGVSTDLNENRIRELGLAVGLVDVKVIAVDQTWSGLKFVIRLRDR